MKYPVLEVRGSLALRSWFYAIMGTDRSTGEGGPGSMPLWVQTDLQVREVLVLWVWVQTDLQVGREVLVLCHYGYRQIYR